MAGEIEEGKNELGVLDIRAEHFGRLGLRKSAYALVNTAGFGKQDRRDGCGRLVLPFDSLMRQHQPTESLQNLCGTCPALRSYQ